MKEYLVTATVQFVLRCHDEEQAKFMANVCLTQPLSTNPRNEEFPPFIDGIEDITDGAT